MINYNIIIPLAFKDYTFLGRNSKYLCENLNAEIIYIITNGKMARFLPSSVRNNAKFRIVDENTLVEGLNYYKINQILKSQGREHTNTGWFFQQFLKMGFAMSEHCNTDYYLSWDADTIPLNKMDFFDTTGKPYFTMKTEYHEPYFEATKILFGFGKLNKRSFISEHMMFNKNIMCEMIDAVSHSDSIGSLWFEKILNSIVPETVSTNSFSEFETYGSYCNKYHPNSYLERTIRCFRRGGLIQGRFVSEQVLNVLSNEYDVVSFEIYDRPPFPWGLICHYYEKFRHYKELFLRKMIINER